METGQGHPLPLRPALETPSESSDSEPGASLGLPRATPARHRLSKSTSRVSADGGSRDVGRRPESWNECWQDHPRLGSGHELLAGAGQGVLPGKSGEIRWERLPFPCACRAGGPRVPVKSCPVESWLFWGEARRKRKTQRGGQRAAPPLPQGAGTRGVCSACQQWECIPGMES